MRAKQFLVSNGENENFRVYINPPPARTPSGKESFYNGLVVKYSVIGSNQEQRITGNYY